MKTRGSGIGWAMMGVVALAFALRIWGIGYGLPFMYHVDEDHYITAALHLVQGVVGYMAVPTGLPNILFPQYAVLLVVSRLTGGVQSAKDLYALYRVDPTVFVLVSRLTVTLLGTATVIVVYFIGARLRTRRVGLIGAFFLAVAFLHVRESHFAVPDVPVTFFVSLTVLLCLVAYQRRNWVWLCIAGIASGYAVATKWNNLPVVFPVALTAILLARRGSHNRTPNIWRLLGLTTCASLGFLVGGIQWFVHPSRFIRSVMYELAAGSDGGFLIWKIDSVPGWLFYAKTMAIGLGIGMLLCAFVGIILVLKDVLLQRRIEGLVFLTFPAVYFLLMGTTQRYFARYADPLLPFVALLAAIAVYDIVTSLRWSRRQSAVAVTVAILVLSLQPLAAAIQFDRLVAQSDTRTSTKEWIEANLPANSRIALDGPYHGPLLATTEHPLLESEVTFDAFVAEGAGLSEHSVDWYRNEGFDYLVTTSFISDLRLNDAATNHARDNFYASLDGELELLRVFTPFRQPGEHRFAFDEMYGPFVTLWERVQTGPLLRVYRIR